MAWEGARIVSINFLSLSLGALLVSLFSPISTFFAFGLVLGLLVLLFLRQWRQDRSRLVALNRELEKDNQFMQQRVVGFGRIMSMIVLETDPQGRIRFINGCWQKLFVDSPACSPPESVYDLIAQSARSSFRSHLTQVLAGATPERDRFELQGTSAQIFPVRFTCEAIFDQSDGAATGLHLVFEDISREERTSQALGQKQATIGVITSIMKSFGVADQEGLEEAMSGALQPVAELVGADRCLLTNWDSDRETMCPGFSWIADKFFQETKTQQEFSLQQCPSLKSTLLAAGFLHIQNLEEVGTDLGICPKLWQDGGIHSLICLPILVNGELDGILEFSTVGREADWSHGDRHLFEVVAAMYSGARQRVAQQQELKAANQKLESMVEFLPDATFVINSEKKVVAWNRAMEGLTGIPKEEMLGQGDFAYAVPFYGDRIPTLINHFGDANLSQWRQLYNFVEVNQNTLYAESFVPFLNEGKGAHLWLTASALYDDEGQVIGAIQSVRDVTYRKKSEQDLRNSEERYRRLVETMNDGMGVVSADGIVTFANESLCKMLRLRREEILGISAEVLFPGVMKEKRLEDWSGWLAAPGEALELEILRRDGSSFPARLSPAALIDQEGVFKGGFAIISDLTKIREAEASIHKLNEGLEQRVSESTHELRATNSALRQSEARYRRIIESLKEGYIFYSQDTQRVFTYMSPSFRNILGFESLDDLSCSLQEDIERPENKASKTLAQKSILGFRQNPWDLHVTCQDGSLRIMEILEVPVFSKAGAVTSVEGIGRDVTEARRNQDLIQNAQRQLVEQEKLAALGSLVAGLSHEINTPVGIGVTAASHLNLAVQNCLRKYEADELTRPDFEEFLDLSRESSEMIATNLNRAADLLQNFKLVATDQSAEMERVFKLKEYLEDVARSLSPRLRNTGFRITIDCPEDLEMKCDPGSLYQILSNLVMNSLMHGFEGMLVGQINISARTVSKGLVITYSDNGNGMNRKDQARIYEPFFTTKRGRGGTGLGMHIVYNNITQNLGGSITCVSKPGRGTRFTIEVPLLAEVEHG